MNKDEAKKLLMSLINNLKLTKADYDTLAQAVMILAMNEPNLKPVNPAKEGEAK